MVVEGGGIMSELIFTLWELPAKKKQIYSNSRSIKDRLMCDTTINSSFIQLSTEKRNIKVIK